MKKRITEDLLSDYFSQDEKRLDLNRKAATIKKSLGVIETELRAALAETDKTRVQRGKFVVELIDGRPHVRWKDELIKQVGAVAVNEIEEAAEISQRLVVRKAT